MNHFERDADGVLHGEGVSLIDLADAVGTPTYVYSEATFSRHYRVMDEALSGVDHLICYSVKANSNLAVLQLLASLGSGFDIVSAGELARVIAAGGDPAKVVFSGVGKRDDEIAAALRAGILSINVESGWELERCAAVAEELGIPAPISLRVNPDVDAKTHAYIATGLRSSKFGVPFEEALPLYRFAHASPHLRIVGVDCHIGSQIVEPAPLVEALERVLELVDTLQSEGVQLHHIDMGGGLGITYKDERPAPPKAIGEAYAARLAPRGLQLLVEPGRVIAGNAGLMLMRVLGTKVNGTKTFVITDAAMNDNIRPSLYKAWQDLVPVTLDAEKEEQVVDVVGPICESGDFFAHDRPLQTMQRGDLLAMRSTGAYGFSMASNYNSRTRAAEVMVHGETYTVVRPREQVAELFASERLLPHVK
ncbi:MAG: diaminopimelate decarboxylase [Myxococcales bacterium]|nr:diaminopimelate decarboxylase [Myxococcales bacterium]